MPCMGPTPAEELDMEREANKRLGGHAWTDYEYAVNVACALNNHLRRGDPIPPWATKWCDFHEAVDAERRELERLGRERERRAKEELYEKLKKELGK